MRVLITGGYGCIGSWIVKALIARQADVWVYDLQEDLRRMRLITEEELGRVHFVQGDVQQVDGLRRAIEEHQVEQVIHLAALQVPACRANPILGAQVNVMGTLAVFEAVRQLAPQVRRVVYASSAAVHSPPQGLATDSARPCGTGVAPVPAPHPHGRDASATDLDGPNASGSPTPSTSSPPYEGGAGGVPDDNAIPAGVPDDAPLAPVTHYGVFKVANENAARVYWLDHSISSVGLRPWTVYGVGRDQGLTSQPTKAMKALAVGRPYHIGYSGRQDLQYVADVAGTFVRCLEAPFEGAAVYNMRGAVIDMPELHHALCEAAPEAAQLITYGGSQIPIAYDLDDSRLLREIGQIPKTPLRDGIRATVDHFRRLAAEGRLDTADLHA